ncbi:serine hydrolase domain-containing protein [Nonomuraea gerenzanensis]|uniref:D-alanyl-D-alanine carboxypeptidase n=1 Tax=Nonomuraea gerenzanensis TaxID=93944 RepID=A0A1M4EEQ7_9ACTN|nr:serine hydrolase domain-containing protein [Nonomuraea gerenzanensis]UBU08896.1 beta-lactamase family protein [Nonomuraea gerenzanensis]SBO97272.1 D-alanyl-D-alanine carboxypeptidase [Nonomuraea gerenzanensis]
MMKLLASAVAGLLALTPAQSPLDVLTGQDGMAGALSHVTGPGGTSVTRRSGTAERGTGKPMIGAEGRFRIASGSKPIIAATVLRLADQRKIDLDAKVDRYLPGVLRGTGDGAAIDGRKITVRMLLRQTSGLPEFLDAIEWKQPFPDFLRVALARKSTARGSFAYANTNYLVLGMIVTAVTGKDFRRASKELILEPYGMRDTYWPAKGDNGIRGPHAHTYGVHPGRPQDGEVDLTDQLPTYAFGPSGGLVSTPADLNRFWREAPLSRLMAGSVPVEQEGWPAGARYGHGVVRMGTKCGEAYFAAGDMPGAAVISGRNRGGRAATVYVTGVPENRQHLIDAFITAMCDR